MFPIQILLGGVPLNLTEGLICLAAALVLTIAFNYILPHWKERVRGL